MSIAISTTNVSAGYGTRRIVDDVTISADIGQVVALIGHNGAGKSTLLRCVFGLVPIWAGSVSILGLPINNPSPRLSLSLGVAYIPQGHRVFRDLNVRESLEVSAQVIDSKRIRLRRIEEILDRFPALRERVQQRADTLSGGEKQILALASALIVAPRVLLADEPCLGLAPRLAESALASLTALRATGTTIILVEQRVRAALSIADKVYVLRRGKVTFKGESSALRDEAFLRQVYL